MGGLATARAAHAHRPSDPGASPRQLRLLPPVAPVPDPPLLERTRELSALEEAVGRLAAGEGSAIVIEAPAGLGKTALLDHAARAVAETGGLVRRAAPAPPERDFPFGVLRALLEAPVRAATEPRQPAALPDAAGPAAGFLLGAALPDAQPSIPLAHSVLWLCASIAGRHGLALIVDDAQWADAASFGLLAYLARRIDDVPVLLVIATRPDASLLGRLDTAAVLRPGPLSTGAPWLLAALAEQLRHDPACRVVAPAVRALVRRRLADLTPAQRAVAATLSMLGDGAGLAHPVIAAAIRDELTVEERTRLHRLRARAVADRVSALADRGALEEAHDLLRSSPTPPSAALLHARARLHLAEGRFEDAYATACDAGARGERLGPRATAAIALAHLGRHREAVDLAETELASARASGDPFPLARALAARAVAEPDHAARAELCARALEELGDRPGGLESVRLRLELGSALIRIGHRVEARQPLRTALADADRAGASPLAQRARRELVATGLRPRRAALEGAGALTPRERQICELAAAGRGNRAIAAELFLSIKTVETHLAAAYRKLGVGGRSELAGRI